MPHLVERDHHHFARDRGLGNLAGFIAHPVENRDIADAENTRDGAKTHVAHGVEKQGQRLHRRRLAARRRHGEIATARTAKIALNVAHNSIFHLVRGATALAANLVHGGLL
jgi:hypothetical protein